MDEIALGVVTDAAGLLSESGAAELREAAAGDADVDRFAFEMEAVDGDAFTVRMEHRIGDRRAVSGNHLERLVGTQPMLDSRQQIEERGIDRFYFVGAEVAQDVVDAIKLVGNVVAIFPVRRAQAFAGMQSVELERAASKLDCGAGHRDRRHNELCRGNRANAEEPPPR